MENKTYKGVIKNTCYCEDSFATIIGDSKPIALEFEDLTDHIVSVRYWISENEKTKEQLLENHVLAMSGVVYADYEDIYSELTGYLWTDATLRVGGHDLLHIIESHTGDYIYIEVDIHD